MGTFGQGRCFERSSKIDKKTNVLNVGFCKYELSFLIGQQIAGLL
jgi:hypothetical protein